MVIFWLRGFIPEARSDNRSSNSPRIRQCCFPAFKTNTWYSLSFIPIYPFDLLFRPLSLNPFLRTRLENASFSFRSFRSRYDFAEEHWALHRSQGFLYPPGTTKFIVTSLYSWWGLFRPIRDDLSIYIHYTFIKKILNL